MAARAYRPTRTWVDVTADLAEERDDRLAELAEAMIPPVSASDRGTSDAQP